MSLIPMRLTIFNKEAKSVKKINACLGAIEVADRRILPVCFPKGKSTNLFTFAAQNRN